jgi:type VI secretion system secreted protein VgrG
MSADFSQQNRLGKLTTVLGPDTLVLLRFEGSDRVNGLFEYQVEALSTVPNIDFDKLIGTHATVEISTLKHGERHFDGIVVQARWSGTGENGHQYILTLRPWFWLAGKSRNQRIFHDKKVTEILTEVFKRYSGFGEPATKFKVTGDYPKLEYTVQYRESDLNFACRLMERFGISYFFKHSDGNHTLVMTDSMDDYDKIPGDQREYLGVESQHNDDEEHFWEWRPERNFTTGAIRQTDFNFKTPTAQMETDRAGDAAYAEGKIESYDYPGDYLEQEEGKNVTGLRVKQERAGDHRHRALGDVLSLNSGMKLTLTGQQVPGVKGNEYLCIEANHVFVSQSYGSGGGGSGDGTDYKGNYVMSPAAIPFPAERKTYVPVVHGPQTAMVVGDGEIDCDEFGRILVRFHWDIKNAVSMRCRVSQSWASKGWGGMVIPRIGMEVVVEFLEGNPDLPLVTGCVYNGKNTVPYPLPANKTRSTFMSDTHQGEGYNELRIEDEKDKEEVYLHAQKDMNVKIEHNKTERVNVNKVESVGHNRANEVTNNSFTVVGGDFSLFVGPSKKGTYSPGSAGSDTQGISSVGTDLGESGTVGTGVLNWTIDKDENVTIGNNQTVLISGEQSLTVGKSQTVNIGGAQTVSIAANASETVGGKKTTTVQSNYVLQAGDSIILKCGSASIALSKDGTIVIKGKDIALKGSGSVVAKGNKINMN